MMTLEVDHRDVTLILYLTGLSSSDPLFSSTLLCALLV